jgi:EAL domain-containing protein (putative c-di-GMP-specific phosphodiesterase class I)/CheY-like chemotaxis protein
MSINSLLAELRSSFGSAPSSTASSPVSGKLSNTEVIRELCFVVDDEPGVRQLMATVLKGMGLQVEEFGSVAGLLTGLARHHPKLIFLDISLDRSDAVEAVHELAKIKYLGAINLMSGRHGELLDEVRKVGERHGLRMLPALLKPFDISAVRKIIHDSFAAPQNSTRAGGVQKRVPYIGIDEALKKNWMKVWYQPKIDLRKKLLVGCEALARIEHPEHGTISPGAFIPKATTESLTRLTEHVLLTVLRDTIEFKKSGICIKPAANVPVEVLLGYPIAKLVRENRPKGDAWNGLIVEVTEDQIVQDINRARDIATQLKIYDISLSIDDFGAGYSSIARLKHFPFAELKLDMSFVKHCAKNQQNAAICKTVIDLAHSFGAVAVAEGIEFADDLRAIYDMGCDLGQGYLLATPMPLDRFVSTLNRRKTAPAAQSNSVNKIA